MDATEFFTPDEQEAFTYGDCWLLTRALHNITGWQMVAVGATGGAHNSILRDWVHMAVRTPEGLVLDISGLNTPEQIIENWSEEFWMMSQETGDIEVFDLDVREWEGLTRDQEALYLEVDPSLSAQRVLAYYIEQMAVLAA